MLFTATQIRTGTLAQAKDMIQHNIRANDKWAIRALLAVYAKQTNDEQASEFTKHRNSVGFNGTDSNILSSFAKQVQKWEGTPVQERRYQSPLSPKQVAIVQKLVAKYSGQLARLVQENQATEAA